MIEIPKNEKGQTITSRIYLDKSLDENLDMFRRLFKNDNTFVVREIVLKQFCDKRCAVLFFDGMVNNAIIADSIIEPMIIYKEQGVKRVDCDFLAKSVVEVNDARVSDNMPDILNAFLYGDSILLVDGDPSVVILNTKGFMMRGISEPDSEKVLSGPKEGFIESFMMNLAMIRRKIKSPDLKYKFIQLGTNTKTTAVICYIDGVCDKKVLNKFEKRLGHYNIDSAIDTNYIVECIKDSRYSPFPTVGTTERPDVFCAKLLEGRVGLLLDGTPVSITAPHIFIESFQSNDDYYLNFLYANTSRVLRTVGFFLSICIPAVFLAMITFHQELIPTKLLFSIYSARQGVPFPAVVEAVSLVIIFEILKEAGTRTPSGIGQSLSIVGALVLGQAAVDARFVSAPMVIVVAFSGITALMIPKLKVPIVVFRIVFLLTASVLGLYGFIFSFSFMLIHICSLKSFGIDYVSDIASIRQGEIYDIFIRFPWSKMRKNDRFIAQKHIEK